MDKIREHILYVLDSEGVKLLSELYYSYDYEKAGFNDFALEFHKMVEEKLIKSIKVENKSNDTEHFIGLRNCYNISNPNDKYCIKSGNFYYLGEGSGVSLFVTSMMNAKVGSYYEMLQISTNMFFKILPCSIVDFK